MNQEQFIMQQVKFRVNAKPKISKLILNEMQKKELTNLFNSQPSPSDLSKEIFTTKIWTESEDDQKEAKEYLSFQGLWPPYVSLPASRWKTRWSDKKNGATLYQCCCGSDMESARKTEVEKQRKLRQMYDFVGCLAFIRVEKNVNNGKYRRVHGYLEHTEACHRALPKKDTPTLKINCDIKDMTELLVRANTSIKDIISLNQYFIRKKLSGRTTLDGQYFLVTIYDVKDARRWIKTQNQWPINVNRSVDYNLEYYFGEGAQDPDLRNSAIYFERRQHRHGHVCLVLATDEQLSLAWQYGHEKCIILDDSFETGNKKLLLYVIMVIDEQKKGIPVGYLLFSKSNNPHTMEENNHEDTILKLLIEYKKRLTDKNSQEFTPKIAIISDFRERVVSQVWSGIDLLYLPHKVRQCWETKADEFLFKGGSNEAIECHQVRNELTDLFNELECASESEIQVKIQEVERHATERHAEAFNNKIDTTILFLYNRQCEFLKYLRTNWINNVEMWSYSDRSRVANKIGVVDVNTWLSEYREGIQIQFNSYRMLRFQQRGHLLRLDVLSLLLLKFITPICIMQRNLWNYVETFLKNEKPSLDAVLQGEELEEGQWRCLLEQHINTIAFEENDPRTCQEARNLLRKSPSVEYNGESLYVIIDTDNLNPETCRDNDEMKSYSVCLKPVFSCHCFHFLVKGGSCAHIMAAVYYVNWLRQQPDNCRFDVNLRHWTIPPIKLPSRKEALLTLQRQTPKKMFSIVPSNDMYDSESENESEDIDSIESYTTPYPDFNNLTSSRQIPENNESMSSIQTWDNTLSSITNKLLSNFDGFSTLGSKLSQNQATIPTGVNVSLRTLNSELVTKLKAVSESEQTKDLINTLKQIQQVIITGSSGGSMNDNEATNNNSMV
ncbi:2702_t:CDS:2 [Cetraspora pellucida]|uniref:2702_t:CDS:1 n=1 Tax=Cetraspora pellucida TaxID=1433469 RepID=A0ACA9JYW4_9GLOM|nr:2702_t:CDS:2 [Cetraspora pellucida]